MATLNSNRKLDHQVILRQRLSLTFKKVVIISQFRLHLAIGSSRHALVVSRKLGHYFRIYYDLLFSEINRGKTETKRNDEIINSLFEVQDF